MITDNNLLCRRVFNKKCEDGTFTQLDNVTLNENVISDKYTYYKVKVNENSSNRKITANNISTSRVEVVGVFEEGVK